MSTIGSKMIVVDSAIEDVRSAVDVARDTISFTFADDDSVDSWAEVAQFAKDMVVVTTELERLIRSVHDVNKALSGVIVLGQGGE